MHAGETLIHRLFYGFDAGNLYLRLDFIPEVEAPSLDRLTFAVGFLAPSDQQVQFTLRDHDYEARRLVNKEGREWQTLAFPGKVAYRDVVEMSLPFAPMGWNPGDEVHLFVRVLEGETERERWPVQGYVAVRLPDPDFEARQWCV